jgi:hypothetical protein
VDDKGTIDIIDEICNPPPNDIVHIPPLKEELNDGLRFKFGGSVNMATFNLYERLKMDHDKIDPQIADIVNWKFIKAKEADKTYKDHVLNSSARITTRRRKVWDDNRMRTKIQIKGFHITKGEFVDALKPNGEVCRNLMSLCSVAIMVDWETKSKIILDQQIIVSNIHP